MASFPKEHSSLYFDALVRTQKKESVLAFIMATYYAKKNNTDEQATKDDIYKRLKYAYGLFRDNVRGYDNGVGSYEGTDSQFSSQYTLGLEMGVWKNSKLDLNDLALKVARNQITITDYFDVVLLNYIQPVSGKIVHPLYQILKYIKENNGKSINKSEILKALELQDDNSNEAVNALYNILIGTSYFKDENGNLVLSMKYNIDELLEKCNKTYLGVDGYRKAKEELENNDEKYIAYLTTTPGKIGGMIDNSTKFKEWMVNSGKFSDKSIENYTYYIGYIYKKGYSDFDIYSISDVAVIDELLNKFKNDEKYIKFNTVDNHYSPTSALAAYRDFLMEDITHIDGDNHYIISIRDYSTYHKLFFDKYSYMYWRETQDQKYNIGDIIYLYFSSDNGQDLSRIKSKAIVTDIHVPKETIEQEKYYENVGLSNDINSNYYIKVKLIENTNSNNLTYQEINKRFDFKPPQSGTIEIDNQEFINYIESNFNNIEDEEEVLTEDSLGMILKGYYESDLWNKIDGIMLFGIKYGDYIVNKNLNRGRIIEVSGIGDSYNAELNKAISIRDFVSYNQKNKKPIVDLSGIERKKGGFNSIYYGIPGCGKSFIANGVAEELTEGKKDFIVRTTFYPDYTNSDFVGQIIPKIDDEDKNSVLYDIQSGPFVDALVKAIDNPSSLVCLIIEEINRGNAAAIFGDLFQLLDRNENGESVYNIRNYTISKYLEKHCINKTFDFENIRIPSNLVLIGTMNTSDQNVFTLDTAFKRRWKMKHITNDIDNSKYAENIIPMLGVSWKEFVNAINKAITHNETNLGINGEDKQLGAYFISSQEWDEMSELIKTDNSKEAAKIFAEKILSYIWEDVAKLDKKSMFKKDYKTFDDVVKDFVENGDVLEINVDR